MRPWSSTGLSGNTGLPKYTVAACGTADSESAGRYLPNMKRCKKLDEQAERTTQCCPFRLLIQFLASFHMSYYSRHRPADPLSAVPQAATVLRQLINQLTTMAARNSLCSCVLWLRGAVGYVSCSNYATSRALCFKRVTACLTPCHWH